MKIVTTFPNTAAARAVAILAHRFYSEGEGWLSAYQKPRLETGSIEVGPQLSFDSQQRFLNGFSPPRSHTGYKEVNNHEFITLLITPQEFPTGREEVRLNSETVAIVEKTGLTAAGVHVPLATVDKIAKRATDVRRGVLTAAIVQITPEHSAVIEYYDITIGCQKITHDAVILVAEAVNRVRSA